MVADQTSRGEAELGLNYPRSGGFWHNSSVDEQLRNTILHELGHNIGLSHTGALKLVGPEGQNYLPEYRSTVNYLYQFSHFGFTDKESRSQPTLPEVCTGQPCYDSVRAEQNPCPWRSHADEQGF
ncbi:hypothetical protein SAMN05444817_104164 [Corynebacterium appendicis CIP 107643]|uniref:Matrixin n=1 Tax=Corynebacterium appendicis CIP 107643 TaxID=1161099 RepID=A0A1N7J8H0_9CORY|nr:hypothetical protein CAPP_10270 [Corynebacterium appendicis CIP 107643]SIS45531.1 hypothetical protein SAMN05444817_104164 [Corynebacterium appendicis CIP 107643]